MYLEYLTLKFDENQENQIYYIVESEYIYINYETRFMAR